MKETCIGFESDLPEHCEVNFYVSGNMGGDAGHGADATIELIPRSGACHLEVEFEDGESQNFDFEPGKEIKRVLFSMLGDWEMEGFAFAIIELGEMLLSEASVKKDYRQYSFESRRRNSYVNNLKLKKDT